MSRTFRQYIRMALFNEKKAAAINKMEERLKAESQARAKAEERLRVEIETRAAMERKVKAQAEKMLLTQHNRYSTLAERVEAQAKEEITKAKAQAKEALEKLRSYTAKQNKEEEKLKEIKEQLKAERQEHRKVEAKAKEEIAKAKAQAKEASEKLESYKAELNQKEQKLNKAEEKLVKAKEQAKTKIIATTKEEGPRAESKKQQNIDAQPAKTTNIFTRIFRHLFHPKSKKRKVALFSLLATLSIIALIFGVSVVNDPSAASGDITVIREDTPAQTIDVLVNDTAPGIAKLIPLDGYNQRNRKTLSADGKTGLVRSSDNNRWATSYGSYTSFDFPDVSIPADALIKSVVVYIEHFEEERFASGKLEWSVGKGWPTKPVVWASIKAPVHEEENHEAVDSWDIISLVDTRDKLNSLQLQVKNNDNVGRKNTLIDYIYLVVEWD